MPVASCFERSSRAHKPRRQRQQHVGRAAQECHAAPRAGSSAASSSRPPPSRCRAARRAPARSRRSGRRPETPRPRSRARWRARQTERIRPRTTRTAASSRVPCAPTVAPRPTGRRRRLPRQRLAAHRARRSASSVQAFSASSAGPSKRGRFRGTIVRFEVHWGGRDGHVCLLTDVPIATAMPSRDRRNCSGFSRRSDATP